MSRGLRTLAGRVAVVTGAASGIGRALACELAAAGSRVALIDVDAAGLAETLRLAGVPDGLAEVVDVSDRDAVERFAAAVDRRFGAVHVVINNAGVTASQNFVSMTDEDFAWVMNVNFWGVVHGTRAFLPYLARADEAALVNVSSVFGLFGFPAQAAYCASKFAVRGFTEALRHELAGTNVTVACVHPGGIRTNIVRRARFYADATGAEDHADAVRDFELLARTSPAAAARRIVAGIRRGEARILIGRDARVLDLMQRLLPVGYGRVLRVGLRRMRALRPRAVAAPRAAFPCSS